MIAYRLTVTDLYRTKSASVATDTRISIRALTFAERVKQGLTASLLCPKHASPPMTRNKAAELFEPASRGYPIQRFISSGCAPRSCRTDVFSQEATFVRCCSHTWRDSYRFRGSSLRRKAGSTASRIGQRWPSSDNPPPVSGDERRRCACCSLELISSTNR